MIMKFFLIIFIAITTLFSVSAEEKTIRVFVALCDNKTQGIMPVGKKIGDGDVPDDNLYWGCSDGFAAYFQSSKKWQLTESSSAISHQVMKRMQFKHASANITLTADAYRGSEIRQCLQDFEQAVASGQYDLVAFIGHNVLMDSPVVEQKPIKGKRTDAIVLCCLSEKYFTERLRRIGATPILLTRQLMYPGSFILHDAIEQWSNGGSLNDIRQAAGKAYARNQKISVKAATGVFAKIR